MKNFIFKNYPNVDFWRSYKQKFDVSDDDELMVLKVVRKLKELTEQEVNVLSTAKEGEREQGEGQAAKRHKGSSQFWNDFLQNLPEITLEQARN